MSGRIVASMCSVMAVALVARGEGEAAAMNADMPPLPPKWGVGFTYYHQDQPYELKDPSQALGIRLANLDLAVDNTLDEYDLQADCWVAPFLDVFVLLGTLKGETTVGGFSRLLGSANLGQVVNSIFGSNGVPDEVGFDYDGFVYGGGVTLVGGWKQVFGSMTATYTWTQLNDGSSSITAWVLAPKVGLSGSKGAAWVGGTFQQVEEHHDGEWTFPGMNVPYSVDFEQRKQWNLAVGLATGLGEHWALSIENGYGDRYQSSLSATYRF
jgi:hypothetical protein